MKILFWVPYPKEGASNRYRVEQYFPYLQKEGILYSLRPFWSSCAFKILYKKGHRLKKCYYFISGTASRLVDLVTIFKYDVVFIHREAYPIGGAFFETVLTIFKKPLIFDFDDAIFLPVSSRSNSFIEKYKNPDKITEIIKMSRHVIVGNSYLADYALRYNRSVSVIPTVIDTNRYKPAAKKSGQMLVIGWMGSVTTLGFLAVMKKIFIDISKEFANVEFKVVGGKFSIDGLSNVYSKSWSLEQEHEDLSCFDIGIMPMPNDEWTKGKCGFKAILYMSMGIACVCSPVGVNNEIITDGVNGFLADTQQQWLEKLKILIKDSALRSKFALAGRKTIEEKYSIAKYAPQYLKILQGTYHAK